MCVVHAGINGCAQSSTPRPAVVCMYPTTLANLPYYVNVPSITRPPKLVTCEPLQTTHLAYVFNSSSSTAPGVSHHASKARTRAQLVGFSAGTKKKMIRSLLHTYGCGLSNLESNLLTMLRISTTPLPILIPHVHAVPSARMRTPLMAPKCMSRFSSQGPHPSCCFRLPFPLPPALEEEIFPMMRRPTDDIAVGKGGVKTG